MSEGQRFIKREEKVSPISYVDYLYYLITLY